jgi:hypothetical protein
VRIRPIPPLGINSAVGVAYELYPPNPDAAFTFTGDFKDFHEDLAAGVPTNWATIWGSFEIAIDELDDSTRTGSPTAGGDRTPPDTDWPRDDRDMNLTEISDLYGGLGNYGQFEGEVQANVPSSPFQFLAPLGVSALVAAGGTLLALPAAVIVAATLTTFTIGTMAMAGDSARRIASQRTFQPPSSPRFRR